MNEHKPINTAILSYGMSGEVFHAPLLEAHPGFTISKIVERSKDRARQHYPHVNSVREINDVLNDRDIELVVVNTPHDTHADLTARVLHAGKHVVVEKPFTNTVAEGQELITLAREKGLLLSVFQNRRWDGDFMTVRNVIESKVLGRMVEFEAHYDRYRPHVDQTTWKEKTGAGSGILYNLGAHMIDQALVLFGLPREINAEVGIQRSGGLCDDYYDIKLRYHDLNVILKSSYLVRENGPRYILHGENGSFVKYGLDPQEQSLKEKETPGRSGWGVESMQDWGRLNTSFNGIHVEGKVETCPGNYLTFYDTIFKALRKNMPLEVTAEQALDVIKIIELSMLSSQKKTTLSI